MVFPIPASPIKKKKSFSRRDLKLSKSSLRSKKGRYVTLYLPPPLASRCEREAKALKITIGKLIKDRMMIESATVFDLMKDFIGSAGKAPRDLSSNPDYFDGFGQDVLPTKSKR